MIDYYFNFIHYSNNFTGLENICNSRIYHIDDGKKKTAYYSWSGWNKQAKNAVTEVRQNLYNYIN